MNPCRATCHVVGGALAGTAGLAGMHEHHGALTMRTGAEVRWLDPNGRRSWITTLADAFRRPRKAAKGEPTKQAKNYGKKIDAGTINLFEHITVVLDDAIARGASQADAEAFGHAILALVRSRFASDLPALEMLVHAETVAQGHADVSTWDLRTMSPKAIADAEALCSVHLIQLARLVEGLRMHKYAGQRAA